MQVSVKCFFMYSTDTLSCYYFHPAFPKSCSHLKILNPTVESGTYVIDPDDEGDGPPYNVTCDMTDKNGVGVTVISHDSENRTLVDGFEDPGSYSRDIQYTKASLSQLASLTTVSLFSEQFIKYECHASLMFEENTAWWVSRDSIVMNYWGGAPPGSYKCACGIDNSCAKPNDHCECDANDTEWREDSGLLTDKTHLPVKQLRFGDTGGEDEKGYHTLGKFKCYGIA
ncbi:neurexin-4-like [Orbicella faveolata]|uniref:neurexin-4-like n=1 Tax=Orbicella faveolata TaxID=48498 RepID=UPI0009E4090D|nr:neurexin-4-like [Orbicella faveolata]